MDYTSWRFSDECLDIHYAGGHWQGRERDAYRPEQRVCHTKGRDYWAGMPEPDLWRAAWRRHQSSLHRFGLTEAQTDVTVGGLAELLREAVCKSCGVETTLLPHQRNSAHIDHIVSVKQQGLHKMSNLQLLCLLCNLRKGST